MHIHTRTKNVEDLAYKYSTTQNTELFINITDKINALTYLYMQTIQNIKKFSF